MLQNEKKEIEDKLFSSQRDQERPNILQNDSDELKEKLILLEN